LILISLGWLFVALLAFAIFRVAAISDARRRSQAEWLAMKVLVERHVLGGDRAEARRLASRIHRAAG
jgi:hypothetical protein